MQKNIIQKLIKTIGIMTVFISLLLFFSGFTMHRMSFVAKSRYETGAGKFLRRFSAEDTHYYSYVTYLIPTAYLFYILGLLCAGTGVFILRSPQSVMNVILKIQEREGAAPPSIPFT